MSEKNQVCVSKKLIYFGLFGVFIISAILITYRLSQENFSYKSEATTMKKKLNPIKIKKPICMLPIKLSESNTMDGGFGGICLNKQLYTSCDDLNDQSEAKQVWVSAEYFLEHKLPGYDNISLYYRENPRKTCGGENLCCISLKNKCTENLLINMLNKHEDIESVGVQLKLTGRYLYNKNSLEYSCEALYSDKEGIINTVDKQTIFCDKNLSISWAVAPGSWDGMDKQIVGDAFHLDGRKSKYGCIKFTGQ